MRALLAVLLLFFVFRPGTAHGRGDRPEDDLLSLPLPVINACSLIIRSMQRPPDLPDFTWGIDGSGLASGDGLVFNPRCEGTRIIVDGFFIAGFPGDGIAIIGPTRASYDFRRLEVSGRSRGIALARSNATVSLEGAILTANPAGDID